MMLNLHKLLSKHERQFAKNVTYDPNLYNMQFLYKRIEFIVQSHKAFNLFKSYINSNKKLYGN